MRDWYQVNEVFNSIQGEGVLVGTPASFIRLQGCTVGCPWCDSGPLADQSGQLRTTNGETRNTWGKGGRRMTTTEIFSQITEKHVIITGGEPTIWDLDGLIGPLRETGHFIQLETSGQNNLMGDLLPNWITWSPKKNLDFKAPLELKLEVSEVKFVVDEVLTWDDVWALYKDLTLLKPYDIHSFVLMPEGSPPQAVSIDRTLAMLKYVPWGVRHQFRYGQRLQYQLGVR